MSIYVGVFQYVLTMTLKNSCINELMYSLNTYYVAANEHGKLHDTAQFFSINISMQKFRFHANFIINFTPSFLFSNFW